MQASAPKEGDIGVAYSYGAELQDGSVLFATGQGVGRTQLVRLDPSWLLLPKTKTADFSTALATTTWNQPMEFRSPDYVSTCMYYRRLPPRVTDPDCEKDHDGTKLVSIAATATEQPIQALCMTLTETAQMATALWNFPALSKGTVSAVVRPGTKTGAGAFNASWGLADASFPPWDAQEQRDSVFAAAIPQLPFGEWSNLSFAFELAKKVCVISLNGLVVSSVTVGRNQTEGALSYLALRSLDPHTTLCVKSLASQ
jgi:hypothetical protein